ncbi:MAG: hypothetical protein J6U52_05245 [Alistipes sp.]|nr:hypothetical protein [Alistipes sp.]
MKPSERVIPANAPKISGTVEPDSIGIGDRFLYTIEVERDLMQEVYFPDFKQSVEHYEMIEDRPVDTLSREGRRLKLRKSYLMAAFQEGIHKVLPEVMYLDKNIIDTLRGDDTLRLMVTTFEIDSTSHTIFDIKPQRTLKFKFGEISGYVTWTIIAIIIVVLLFLIAKRILAHYGKSFSDIFKPAPTLPQHEIALRDLKKLHSERLWQEDKHKLYYSGLTDILRAYIAGQFGVGALEMTSDEIIEAMRGVEIPQKQKMDLTELLRDADLVKFAKATPEAEANEAAYTMALSFVEQTMPQPEEEDDEKKE